MKNIIILFIIVLSFSCSKEPPDWKWNAYATINGKKVYGSGYVVVNSKKWIHIGFTFRDYNGMAIMLLEIRDRLKPLDVGKYPLLGGNDSETIFEKNLDKYNNAALIINDYDTSSEPYLVCQKCNKDSYYEIKHISEDKKYVEMDMDLYLISDHTAKNSSSKKEEFRVKNVFLKKDIEYYD